MKSIKKLFLGIVMLLGVTVGYSQPNMDELLEDPRYGNTREEREEVLKMMSYFRAAMAAENTEDALGYMRTLMEKAPRSTENIYEFGRRYYREKRDEAQTPEEAKVYNDTLMMIYDKRVENFGNHRERGRPYIFREKAYDYYNFSKNRPQLSAEDRDMIYKLFRNAIEVGGENIDMNLLLNYFSMVVADYNMDKVETEFVINEYDDLGTIIDKSNNAEKAENKEKLDGMFIQAGVADCETLESLFKPRYEANPSDLDLTKKIVKLMNRNKCKSDFQLMVTENLFKLEPTPEIAGYLAAAFRERNQTDKAAVYLKEAVDKATDPTEKSNMLVEMAVNYSGVNNQLSANYAKQAISISPDNASAYLILALAYSNSIPSSCKESFDQSTAYWIVVDTLSEARRRAQGNPDLSRRATELINTYSAHFPRADELFFDDIKEGDSFTVNCGIVSGKTTVRARK